MNEGRSEFDKDKDGVLTFDANMEWRGFNLGAAQTRGDNTMFNESQLYFTCSHELFKDFEAGLVYAYIWFPSEDKYDNEVGFAFSFSGLSFATLEAEYIYSEKAEGAFMSLAMVGSVTFLDDRLTLEPYVMESFDFGFVTEEHDGANNLQIGVDVNLAIDSKISLTASVNHSWAQEDIKREAGGDDYYKTTTWASAGAEVSF